MPGLKIEGGKCFKKRDPRDIQARESCEKRVQGRTKRLRKDTGVGILGKRTNGGTESHRGRQNRQLQRSEKKRGAARTENPGTASKGGGVANKSGEKLKGGHEKIAAVRQQ